MIIIPGRAGMGIMPRVNYSPDTALAESINGLYCAESIHRCGRWRSGEAVGSARLDWTDGFNRNRRLEAHGKVLPAAADACSDASQRSLPLAVLIAPYHSGRSGAVQCKADKIGRCSRSLLRRRTTSASAVVRFQQGQSADQPYGTLEQPGQ
jgi:hypothetical protein